MSDLPVVHVPGTVVEPERPLIYDGWDPDSKNWDQGSAAGRVVLAVRAGATYHAAARFARINKGTLSRWIALGKEYRPDDDRLIDSLPEPERLYVELHRQIEGAEGDVAVEMVGIWRRHAQEHWQAARDFLARRFPHEWGPRENLQVTGPGGGPIEVQHSHVLDAVFNDPEVAQLVGKVEERYAQVAQGDIIDVEPVPEPLNRRQIEMQMAADEFDAALEAHQHGD